MMAIGELAQRAGLRASAIRYYERLGLLPAPARESGRRRYTADTLAQLRVIRFATASGFSLAEVRELFAGRPYSLRLKALARAKLVELDAVIERAREMQALVRTALRCDCLSLEQCGRRMIPPDEIRVTSRAQR